MKYFVVSNIKFEKNIFPEELLLKLSSIDSGKMSNVTRLLCWNNWGLCTCKQKEKQQDKKQTNERHNKKNQTKNQILEENESQSSTDMSVRKERQEKNEIQQRKLFSFSMSEKKSSRIKEEIKIG